MQVRQRHALQRDAVGCIHRDHDVASNLLASALNGSKVGEKSIVEFDGVVGSGTGCEVRNDVLTKSRPKDESVVAGSTRQRVIAGAPPPSV
jgi:hypothetical protein